MTNDYQIRLARIDDTPHIMGFIKDYWSKNHIFANDIKLFNFQYLDDDKLNFVIATNQKGRIVGILGFIVYDQLNNDNKDIFMALWKVIPNLADPFLGVKLIKFLQSHINSASFHCVGITKETIGIYKYLGFKTGKLHHYAAFNSSCNSFKIAVPPPILKNLNDKNKFFKFHQTPYVNDLFYKISEFDFYKKKIPFKSVDFLIKRYENHPYFQYIVYEITVNEIIKGLIITREIQYNNSQALRIVDVIADNNEIGDVINDFAYVINNSDYEYVDVYISGLNNEEVLINNYEKISNSSDIIVPNYFEPFELKNIDIYYMSSNIEESIIFRGDGDQDRPSSKKR